MNRHMLSLSPEPLTAYELGMGDKGVEIIGRELLGGKGEHVSAHSSSSLGYRRKAGQSGIGQVL